MIVHSSIEQYLDLNHDPENEHNVIEFPVLYEIIPNEGNGSRQINLYRRGKATRHLDYAQIQYSNVLSLIGQTTYEGDLNRAIKTIFHSRQTPLIDSTIKVLARPLTFFKRAETIYLYEPDRWSEYISAEFRRFEEEHKFELEDMLPLYKTLNEDKNHDGIILFPNMESFGYVGRYKDEGKEQGIRFPNKFVPTERMDIEIFQRRDQSDDNGFSYLDVFLNPETAYIHNPWGSVFKDITSKLEECSPGVFNAQQTVDLVLEKLFDYVVSCGKK